MCGFAGIVHWTGEEVPQADPRKALGLLRHRGPDEQRVEFPSPSVGLAHCRLKIIDLSEAAAQPMTNESRSLWLCFNGEIYNFQELRRELEALGHRFRSRSDTEVILRGYEAWGEGVIARLEGMFALALWDASRRHLLLARDRTGKKPLYYWTDGRCLAFGSEVKALLAHAHVPRRFNERILRYLLTFGYPPSGSTCYDQIRQLPPASFLRFGEDRPDPSPVPYWRPPPLSGSAPDAAPLGDERRTIQELRELLRGAVRRRLISDVPLGAFLSGGLDSTIVVKVMRDLLPQEKIRTFSIGFEGDPRYNETSFAQIAARRFQTEHTVFTVTAQAFHLLERLVWHYDQPFGDSSAVPTYLLAQLARSQVTVALTGDGGDELFAGYDRFSAGLLAESIPLPLRRLASWGTAALPAGASQKSAWARAHRFLRSAPQPLSQRLLAWASIFPDAAGMLQSEQNGTDPAEGEASAELSAIGEELPPLTRMLRINFQDYLPNDLQVKLDRCTMAHGLEARSPFLDTQLIEWSFRLADDLKLRRGISKWILRRAFRGELPEKILRRSKMGFGVPLGAWLRGPWREPVRDLLGTGARLLRYLRPDAVQALLRSHQAGREDAGQRLWLLLTFEVWLRSLEQSGR